MRSADAPLASTDFVALLREALYGKADRLGQNFAEFLRPTSENVVTWGAHAALNFTSTGLGDGFDVDAGQLIYVERRRPTSYNVLTVLDLGVGWTGEVTWALLVEYVTGIGGARVTVKRTLSLAGLLTSNTQPIKDVLTLPAAVLSCRAHLVGVSAAGGPHTAGVTMLAAPVYA